MIFEKQDYQQHCIDNIKSILVHYDFKTHSNLKQCLQEFYNMSNSSHLPPKKNISDNLNIDILMETGTGKTFTYLNLIFELHKSFQQNKFILFVPRKAILESIKQNIQLTKDYFYIQYQKHIKTYFYTGRESQSAIISQYIKNTDELSLLVLTNSAIDKDSNILNRANEGLFNTKSIFENIIALNPISIIDEPHLLKGEAFKQNFNKLKSLYFRFGATFPKEKTDELSNMAYCLDSMSAFRQYLVKQIRVNNASTKGTGLRLKSANKKGAIFIYNNSDIEQEIILKKGDDCGKIGLNGIEIMNIESNKVYLSNKQIIEKENALSQEEISRILKIAIDLHFEKELTLFEKNIKALSLFFIPNIADFRGDKAFIKDEFEALYKAKRKEILKQDLPKSYREYLTKDFDESGNLRVHQGYFSGDAKLSSKDSKNQDNQEAADIALILKDKEKLLSFDTSLRFIFSVWALQEGWDNPNVFTLVKLASTDKETSIHQQVGRGLRLCVNSTGKRITHRYFNYDDNAFYDINYLDIVVSARESGFIDTLQKEVNDLSFECNNENIDEEFFAKFGLNKSQASRILIRLEDEKMIAFNETQNNYTILKPLDEFLRNDERCKELLGIKFTEILNALKAQRINISKLLMPLSPLKK
ncbi:DEAD/DEAH box helicase family protein [uncultured Helicobacter sp.]|uniref:DEAD/DEAH box helicase family protein n=1 Tax=uncultured Helicobacter sp. TaxID=175537 RepID=UPI00345C0765